MSWDSVPWFVGGGAQHSPEIARVVAFAAFGGAEGVVSAGDLKVSPLDVPGAGVRVAPGAAAILNKASGGDYQAYVGRLASEDTASIAATGSGETRSDLVVVRVEDPYMAGEPWPDPADPTVGPYIFTRVIAGVAPGTTEMPAGMSGFPLARIDIPASTGTITSAMIVDLRTVAQPRRTREVFAVNSAAGNTLTSTTLTAWPAAASTTIAVPPWATKAIVRGSVGGVSLSPGHAHGDIRVSLGTVATPTTAWDETIPSGTVIDRKFWRVVGTVAIPEAMRGTQQTIRLEADRASDATLTITADTSTSSEIDIEFIEAVA